MGNGDRADSELVFRYCFHATRPVSTDHNTKHTPTLYFAAPRGYTPDQKTQTSSSSGDAGLGGGFGSAVSGAGGAVESHYSTSPSSSSAGEAGVGGGFGSAVSSAGSAVKSDASRGSERWRLAAGASDATELHVLSRRRLATRDASAAPVLGLSFFLHRGTAECGASIFKLRDDWLVFFCGGSSGVLEECSASFCLTLTSAIDPSGFTRTLR